MRHVRCRSCGKNRKRRSTSTYVICEKCGSPACKACSLEIDVPNRWKWSKSDPDTVKKVVCRFCAAEAVLSC